MDPQTGVAEMWAADPFYVRLLGVNNHVLSHPVIPGVGIPDDSWRRLHARTCSDAKGYLFHTDRRNCWAVLTWPGESADVTVRAESPLPPGSRT